MAKWSLEAARTKELEILPEFYNEVWEEWLGNIQDWCISR